MTQKITMTSDSRHRQAELEAAARSRQRLDGASDRAHQTSYDAEAEPGRPWMLPAPAGLEDRLELCRWNPRAVVRDGHHGARTPLHHEHPDGAGRMADGVVQERVHRRD